ncbi:MAG: F0F1 ATP synthase subunit B [Gammaproteobacteria bacterium 39-13]|nr:F0F1 ATP synthase subunit B [Gammaproteobacteria bacterium]OJV86219.1 MAG: F0F1 ATP synthase subunit B [Gammaproteobacteria bacterium 39-13]
MNINVTLIGQMITFLLFVWFTKQFVWPPVIKALKERQAKIADGLAAAERGHLELSRAQEQVTAMLKEGKEAAAGIIVEAKKQADSIVDASRQQAHEEGVRIIQQAHLEVGQMVLQAKESLRKQVASIALVGAEKVLERTIDPKAHQDMLEKLAQEIV